MKASPLPNPVPHGFIFYPESSRASALGLTAKEGAMFSLPLPDLLWKSPAACQPQWPRAELPAAGRRALNSGQGEEGQIFTLDTSQSPGPSELLPSC